MYLIYNVLTAKTKDNGDIYITTLGYSVNDNNEIDYTQLINDIIDGTFIASSGAWYSVLPFSISGASFIANGTKCTVNDIAAYDVVYYSGTMKTVWAYNNKVTGPMKTRPRIQAPRPPSSYPVRIIPFPQRRPLTRFLPSGVFQSATL
jgi:hypothetical protein